MSVSDENKRAMEDLTGKTITKNGDQVLAEVIEMAEETKKPGEPCWVESSCSDPEKEDSE